MAQKVPGSGHAKENGLRRVEAYRTDADLGTLFASCPECGLYGHVASFLNV